MHRLPTQPVTFARAVESVRDGVDHSLDAVLLLDFEESWHLLYGDFPSFAPA
jgi:hypothetical protein